MNKPNVDSVSKPTPTMRTIVSVEFPGRDDLIDLEVPAHIASGRLSELIAYAVSPESIPESLFSIFVESHGITLSRNQSLADADVWDGAKIVLRPVQNAAMLIARISGAKYPLLYSEIYVGRAPQSPANRLQSATIDISSEPTSQTVSRQHACIRCHQTIWTIEHLPQAANPTWVNDTELTTSSPVSLQSGSIVRFGDLEFVFSQDM